MHKYILILGSSQFLAHDYFLRAKELIISRNIKILSESKTYKSIGKDTIRNILFYNCALAIECSISPITLLRELKNIESNLGRMRPYKNAPRTIDIDIFLNLSFKYDHPILKIPHKDGFKRDFFIRPALDIFNALKWPKPYSNYFF